MLTWWLFLRLAPEPGQASQWVGHVTPQRGSLKKTPSWPLVVTSSTQLSMSKNRCWRCWSKRKKIPTGQGSSRGVPSSGSPSRSSAWDVDTKPQFTPPQGSPYCLQSHDCFRQFCLCDQCNPPWSEDREHLEPGRCSWTAEERATLNGCCLMHVLWILYPPLPSLISLSPFPPRVSLES